MLLNYGERRSNQSILKEIIPEYSLEGLMLKLQYFGHRMRSTDSLKNTLMLGKIECRSKRGWWMTEDEMFGWHHRFNGYEFEQSLCVGDGQGSFVCFSLWGCKEWLNLYWLVNITKIIEVSSVTFKFSYRLICSVILNEWYLRNIKYAIKFKIFITLKSKLKTKQNRNLTCRYLGKLS